MNSTINRLLCVTNNPTSCSVVSSLVSASSLQDVAGQRGMLPWFNWQVTAAAFLYSHSISFPLTPYGGGVVEARYKRRTALGQSIITQPVRHRRERESKPDYSKLQEDTEEI